MHSVSDFLYIEESKEPWYNQDVFTILFISARLNMPDLNLMLLKEARDNQSIHSVYCIYLNDYVFYVIHTDWLLRVTKAADHISQRNVLRAIKWCAMHYAI